MVLTSQRAPTSNAKIELTSSLHSERSPVSSVCMRRGQGVMHLLARSPTNPGS